MFLKQHGDIEAPCYVLSLLQSVALVTTFLFTYPISTVVPATAGQRSFRGKMALRGRWPLVTGNGHMRHYVKSNTHIYFTANAQHFKAQRSITVLYTVRDETNNAENV